MNNKEKYHATVKAVAKENRSNVIDFAHDKASKCNVYSALKNGYPNNLAKAVSPFKFFGAKVEVKITASSGKVFYL